MSFPNSEHGSSIIDSRSSITCYNTFEDDRPASPATLRAVRPMSPTLKKPSNAVYSPVEDFSEPVDSNSFPLAIYYILPNEFGERFCFYGIKNLLNLYLQDAFNYSPSVAKSQVHLFNGLAYFFPLIGAALSDSFLGKFRTIVLFSVIYLFGNALLSILSINHLVGEYGNYPYWACILPLVLIAVGTGGIKPCVSSHGGDQFNQSHTTLIDRFFSLFYLSVNVGSFFGQYIATYAKANFVCYDSHCYLAAFGIPTLAFFIGLLIFIAGYKHYRIAPPFGTFMPLKSAKLTLSAFIKYTSASKYERESKGHWLKFAEEEFGSELVEETRLLGKVIVMAMPMAFYWVLYDQNSTEWQNQYELMNHNIFGLINIPTETSSIINSILILITVPFFSYIVYPFLASRNINLSLIQRILCGYFLLILAFIVSIFLQFYVESNASSIVKNGNVQVACPNCVNGAFQLPQWILLSLGEAMFGPTGNQFAYTQVGPQMKASSASIWLLTTAFGNYIIIFMEQIIGDYYGPTRQAIYTGLSTCSLVVLYLLSKFWFVSKEDEAKLPYTKLTSFETQSLVSPA